MRRGAFGVLAAALLLAGGASTTAAAELGASGATDGAASLLPTTELQAGGPGQWIWPGVMGGPYGGFALPQTAAMFGYTNAGNPIYQAGVLGSTGVTNMNTLQSLNALSGLYQTGLAPGAALSLGSLSGLGLGTIGFNGAGATTFSIGGGTAVVPPGASIGNTSLGSFYGGVNPAFLQPTGFPFFNPLLSQLGLNFVR